jgi:hypothetical protein
MVSGKMRSKHPHSDAGQCERKRAAWCLDLINNTSAQ